MRFNRSLSVFLLVVSGIACKTSHKATTNPSTAAVNTASVSAGDDHSSGLTEGIVHKINSGDCQYTITVKQGDKEMKFYPLNLPEELRVDELKIKFSYKLSRTKARQGCPDARPVTIESGKKM